MVYLLPSFFVGALFSPLKKKLERCNIVLVFFFFKYAILRR